MRAIEEFTWQLKKYARTREVTEGKLLHSQIVKMGLDHGTLVGNLIVQMYGAFGEIQQADAAFNRIAEKNVFSWTLMFTAYAQNGHLDQARLVFNNMPEKDVVAWTAMLTAYAQRGYVQQAEETFNEMPMKNLISWNAMLTAYGQNSQYSKALSVYRLMQQDGRHPDETTFVSVLDVCIGLRDLSEGKSVHRIIVYAGLELELNVGTSLVNMYGKLMQLTQARNLLDKMPQRDLITWTAMLTAYSQRGHSQEARTLFLKMDLEGFQPDNVAYVSVIHACTWDSSLLIGRIIHENIRVSRFSSVTNVGNALITFYGRCGCVDEAWRAFDAVSNKNLTSWNAMLGTYADNACVEETLELYMFMLVEGILPDEVTFVPVLSACSHGGLLQEGCYHFASIRSEYNSSPVEEHVMCILDILGRAGELNEAEVLINRESLREFKKEGMSTLLGACKMHGHSVRGGNVVLHDYARSGMYILLSDIYAGKNNTYLL